MIIKKKKADKIEISEYSFKDINSFENVPFDNDHRNVIFKSKHPEELGLYTQSFAPYESKFVNDDKLMVAEDFTKEVKEIQDELRKQKTQVFDLEEAEEQGELSQFDLEEDQEDGSAENHENESGFSPKSGEGDKNYRIEDSIEKLNVGSKLFHDALNETNVETVRNENVHAINNEIPENKQGKEIANQLKDRQKKAVDPFVPQVVENNENQSPFPEQVSELGQVASEITSYSQDDTIRDAIDQEQFDAMILSEKERAFDEGFDHGYGAGEEKGFLSVRDRVESYFMKTGQLLQELEKLKTSIYSDLQETFQIVLEKMTKKVIRTELSLNPDLLKAIFLDVVEKTVKKEAIKIKVNADDYAFFAGFVPNLKETFQDLEITEIVQDSGIAAGNFTIETSTSIVESNIDKQVDLMVEQLDFNLPAIKAS